MYKIIYFSIGFILFILASFIYILFRPTSLLMFHWAENLNLLHTIQIMRNSVNSFNFIPEEFVFSLPFGLWILSYLFFIEVIWKNSKSKLKFLWFWFVPLISIGAELLQIKNIIPGVFDWKDLCVIILATIFGFFTTSI